MILEIGKAGKCRFIRGIKKTNIFECGPYGMVVEREKQDIFLYATNSRCSEIYCVVPLGGKALLKQKPNFIAAAYTPEIMVLDCGEVLAVVDFSKKRLAVNKPEIPVKGRGEWDRMPWEPYFNAMFGLPVGEAELAQAEALRNARPAGEEAREQEAEQPALPEVSGIDKFWDWFAQHEDEIVEKTLAGGEEAEIITARIRVRLAVAFPYEKPEDIEFQLTGDGTKNQLAVYHFNRERMKADAEELCRRIPEELQDRWGAYTEA